MTDCSKCIRSEICANHYANVGCDGCEYYLQDTRPHIVDALYNGEELKTRIDELNNMISLTE